MRREKRATRTLAAVATALLAACGGSPPQSEPLTLFAAASLQEVVHDLAADFDPVGHGDIVFNFAGSNALARQIDAAPGADVFLSAEPVWIEQLDRAGRTVPGTRRCVFGNRLVLIAHRSAQTTVREPRDLASGRYRFLALADPEGVPAGRYARASLRRLEIDGNDLWQLVAGRVAPTLDVRAALALVESDPEILGIVYHTDARTSNRVQVLYEFPPEVEAPITYCAVVVAGGRRSDLGRRFVDYLASTEARDIARRHGFEIVG